MADFNHQNIKKQITGISYPVGAEIGVHRGELSEILLKNNRNLFLYMIDIWSHDSYLGKGANAASETAIKNYQDNCDENYAAAIAVHERYPSRSKVHRIDSIKMAWRFANYHFDFVYIDGAHDYLSVKTDVLAWMPKVKHGGWLCGHDYDNPLYPDVKLAVDEMFGDQVQPDSDFTWFVRMV